VNNDVSGFLLERRENKGGYSQEYNSTGVFGK